MNAKLQEQASRKASLRRIFVFVLPSLLLVLAVAYTLVFTLAVRGKVRSWQGMPGEAPDTLAYSSAEWSLIREKTFLKARIAMAGSDSIGMTVNFRDSLVQLEHKGVVLRQVKFEKASVSRFFGALKPVAYNRAFSRPFRITEIEGSIIKEPIVVRKAPRDTTEAAATQSHIDTTRVEFIEWHLQLDSALVVSFVQSDRRLGHFDWPTWKYRIRQHYKTLSSTLRDLSHLRKPSYYPEVTVYIPRQEAKSFYRALPPNGLVVLNF